MKTIVVYYSLEGNTEYAAQKIAEKLGAELLSIRPKKAFPDKGFRKFFWGGKSAVMAAAPELEPYSFEPSAFDRVIIGFPVWASNVAPPINTFVKENDLSGKRIAFLACQSGSGAEKAFAKLRKNLGIDSTEAELILIDPKSKPTDENEQRLLAFCNSLDADKH